MIVISSYRVLGSLMHLRHAGAWWRARPKIKLRCSAAILIDARQCAAGEAANMRAVGVPLRQAYVAARWRRPKTKAARQAGPQAKGVNPPRNPAPIVSMSAMTWITKAVRGKTAARH